MNHSFSRSMQVEFNVFCSNANCMNHSFDRSMQVYSCHISDDHCCMNHSFGRSMQDGLRLLCVPIACGLHEPRFL